LRKLALPLLLLTLLAACSSPTDVPAREWVDFLEKQQQHVIAGTFDRKGFVTKGKQIADRLNDHRNPQEGRPLVTKEVLKRWQAANTSFEETCHKARNQEALAAYREVAEYMMEGWPQPEEE
jgi:hypothetical protein